MTAADLLDRFLVALCVWREARGESPYGKQLVASVVANRKTDSRWPDTYAEVVTQRRQFSAFDTFDANATLFPKPTDPSWEDSVQAANAVMDDGPITTANHYHTVNTIPVWADVDKLLLTEGHHRFYRL